MTDTPMSPAELLEKLRAPQYIIDPVHNVRVVNPDYVFDVDGIELLTEQIAAHGRAERERCEQAVRICRSLDENGYICEKSDAIKAIRALQERPHGE